MDFKWLSHVPEKLLEAKKWVEKPDADYTWSSLEGGYRITILSQAAYGEVSQRYCWGLYLL